MKWVIAVIFITNINIDSRVNALTKNQTCGIDNSPVSVVYEGLAPVQIYPWMGLLYYPLQTRHRRFTTAVVLVTKQIVIATASELDKFPKIDFREKAKVVLGGTFGQNEIKVRDYSYHPEFKKNTYSALAMVQLEVDHIRIELRPICQPPEFFIKPEFYVLTMPEGYKNPKIRIHRTQHVDLDDCKDFYRRSGLGQESMWPVYSACARAVSGGRCVWRSGSVMAVKQDGRWRLLGFGVYGPGCGAPARFLDYGIYHKWIRRSTTTMGLPAITRLDDNHLIMRRTLSSVQRFGPCDAGETKGQLYMDRMTIFYMRGTFPVRYNVSLYANVEYSCVIFTARALYYKAEYRIYETTAPDTILPNMLAYKPVLKLRRWCANPTGMCYGFQHIELHFYVEMLFSQNIEFAVRAYGKEAKVLVPRRAIRLANRQRGVYPSIMRYPQIIQVLKEINTTSPVMWFFNWSFPTTTKCRVFCYFG